MHRLVIAFALSAFQPLGAQEPSPSDRAAIYRRYLELDSHVQGGSLEPHWMADGSSFWYAAGASEETTLWKVDPFANTRTRLSVSPDEGDERSTPRRGELPSPDGRWIATVREFDLWLTSTEDGRALQLTSDGVERHEWVLRGAQWSPDASMLVVTKDDSRQVSRIPLVDWLGSSEEVEWAAFGRKPGQPIMQAELFVIDTRSGRTVRIDTGADPDQRIFPLQWLPDGSHLLLFSQNAYRPDVALVIADAASGATRVVLDETHPAQFITVGPRAGETPFILLEDGTSFLWLSQRTGWRHLYLYDLDGTPIRPVTRGEFSVDRIVRVDEETGWLYFTARGERERPHDRHLYRVDLQGQRLTRLTEAPGQHEIRFAPSGQFYLDTHSSADRAPAVELRRSDGTLIRILETADVTALEELGWTPPEEFVVRSTDGETDLHGVLYKPFDFDAGRNYPIVVHAGEAGRRFAASAKSAAIAQLGFLVLEVDVREPLLSRRPGELPERLTIGRYEVGDYVAALHGLAADRSYLDLSRVGIVGSSYGGYHAIRAMLQAPEVFHVGIAVAAITDAYGHPNFYGLGPPEENREYFEQASNLSLAENLEGKLLLIHGTHDTAVPFSHAMKMVDALTRAGKSYDLIVMPGWGHWWPDTEEWERYRSEAVRRYFQEHLDP